MHCSDEDAVMRGSRVRTLIVEDEPLARRTLHAMLSGIDWVECVGEAADGEQAVALIVSLSPELIFLDVQLPGFSGVEVLERTRTNAAVIFATAFDTYALVAFELGAIDYVTKPFGPDRVARALGRAAMQVRAMREVTRERALSDAATPPSEASSIRARLDAVGSRPVTRMFARDRGTVIPIPVAD